MRNLITVALFTSLLCGCGNVVSPNPGPSKSPSPSMSASASSPTPAPSVSASPSPQTAKYKYELPVKFTERQECGNITKELYQVKDDTFSYNLNDQILGGETPPKDDIQTEKLSKEDIDAFKKVVNEANLSLLAEKDVQLPKDGPQTMECRGIGGLTINVDGKDKLFERNERFVQHTKEYTEAFDKIRNKLVEFKDRFVKSVELNKEFDLKIGKTVKFEQNNTLKLDSVTEDSRCPSDVQCIQAGQVSFKFKLQQQFMPASEFVLTSRAGTNTLNVKKVNDYTFTLVKVLPEGFKATATPKADDYTVTLKVEKK